MTNKRGVNNLIAYRRVRDTALTLKKFTLELLCRCTGLSQKIVEAELADMISAGYVSLNSETVEHLPSINFYEVTMDVEKRLQLLDDIESTYPQQAVKPQPSSRHYLVAVTFLNSIEQGLQSRAISEAYAQSRLKRVLENLKFAWYDEGEPVNITKAFFDFQAARIALLQGKSAAAGSLFTKVKEETKDYEDPEVAALFSAAISYLELLKNKI
jgi:hypothetical protein